MRILVTGASGLLGANLALHAANQHSVVGTVNQHKVKTSAFQVSHANLLNPGVLEKTLDEIQPDWVINCAALASLEACETDPKLAYKLNAELPSRLARIVGRSGARLVHVSTDAVFDGRRAGDLLHKYREEDEANPLSTYGRSKLAGEDAVRDGNSQAIISRVNLFGWSISGTHSLAEYFYYNLKDSKRVNGFTDVIFCPLLVNDLAEIFLQMLEQGLSGLYHVFSPECTSKYAFGVAIARRFGLDETLIEPISVTRAGLAAVRSPNLTMCTDKLRTALGHPLPTWQDGLERLAVLRQQGYPQKIAALADSATLK
jgi:dTDP-4-dehydrorhamnose reductase